MNVRLAVDASKEVYNAVMDENFYGSKTQSEVGSHLVEQAIGIHIGFKVRSQNGMVRELNANVSLKISRATLPFLCQHERFT